MLMRPLGPPPPSPTLLGEELPYSPPISHTRSPLPLYFAFSCPNSHPKYFHQSPQPAGGEYYYFGPDSQAFTKSSEDISKGGDAIDQTLDSLYSYKSSSTHAHGMWNDQPTKEKAAGSIYAHSKGVFHFDDEQGFYLIHSVPAYPSNKDHGYDQLESTSTTYGQSFMCLTMKTSEFDKLGKDLQTMHVFPYDSDFSDDLTDVVPNMVDAMDKVENKDVQSVETQLTTVGGER
jgi:hypothetical protein